MADKVHYTAHAELDKPDGIYRSGETARCRVDFYRNGEKYHGRIRCRIFIENKMVSSRNADYQGKTLEFKIRCLHPGWVLFSFQILSSHDRALRGEKLWKHPMKPSVVEDIGAVFDPDQLRRLAPRPKDFDAFWERQKAQLDKVPFRTEKKELPVPDAYKGKVRLFAVTLDIGARQHATGYLAVPENAAPKSCPAYIWFLSWCWTDTLPEMALSQAARGAVAFAATWHGLPVGMPQKFYADEQKRFNSLQGVEKPETWIMGRVFLRVLRELEFLKSQPEWNGRKLVVHGGSLGGIQTLCAAALDPAVTLAIVGVPCFNEFITGKVREPSLPLKGKSGTPERRQAAEYFAGSNFAPLITSEIHFCTGFVDTSCPPSGVYVTYNELPADTVKSMSANPRTGHYGTTPHVNGNRRLEEYFQSIKVQKYEPEKEKGEGKGRRPRKNAG